MNASPSEDDEDNAEFYDAQESDTFTLGAPSEGLDALECAERERNDSQASDDGSSSEGDPNLQSGSNAARPDNFRIMTDDRYAYAQMDTTGEIVTVSM